MEFLKSLFTPSEDYNYKIIFLSYLVLSLCCLVLYITAFYWKDIQGFWIVLSPYLLGLPYYGLMWKKQSSIKEKTD
ncbi:hypothetical protein BLSTO_02337 [Blastocystis sp. subtype 1]